MNPRARRPAFISTTHDTYVPYAYEGRQRALVDLLDRVLAGGVVITGEVTLCTRTLCIADIDLVRISLRALINSVRPGMAAAPRAVDADARELPP
jgi:hypothetical protein